MDRAKVALHALWNPYREMCYAADDSVIRLASVRAPHPEIGPHFKENSLCAA